MFRQALTPDLAPHHLKSSMPATNTAHRVASLTHTCCQAGGVMMRWTTQPLRRQARQSCTSSHCPQRSQQHHRCAHLLHMVGSCTWSCIPLLIVRTTAAGSAGKQQAGSSAGSSGSCIVVAASLLIACAGGGAAAAGGHHWAGAAGGQSSRSISHAALAR